MSDLHPEVHYILKYREMPDTNTSGGGTVNQNDIYKIVQATVQAAHDLMSTVIGNVTKNADMYKKRTVRRNIRTFLDAMEELMALFDEKSPFIELISTAPMLKKQSQGALELAKYLGVFRTAMASAINTIRLISDLIMSIQRKKLLNEEAYLLVNFMYILGSIADSHNDPERVRMAFEAMTVMYNTMLLVAVTADLIRGIRILLLTWKVRMILRFFRALMRLIIFIALRNIKTVIQARIKAWIMFGFLEWALHKIAQFVWSLIKITLLIAVFIVLSPVMFLGITIIVLLAKLVGMLANRLMRKNILEGLETVVKVIIYMSVITILMAALIILALQVRSGFKSGIMFILEALAAISLFIGYIVLIGFLRSIPIVRLYMRLGISFIKASVLSMLIIAASLLVLETIKLNRAKILMNVRTIIALSNEIIFMVFNSMSVIPNNENKGPLANLLTKIFGGIAVYLAGATILVLTMISTIAIMVIAMMLRWTQAFKLDPAKILNNVSIIMTTAMAIIELAFAPMKEPGQEAKNDGWAAFLRWGARFLKGIGTVINAILSMVFVVLTFVSVFAILLIAVMLKALENLDLDPGKVMASVNLVIWTAVQVQKQVFDPGPQKTNGETRKGFWRFLGSILKGIGAILEAIMSIAFLATTLIAICALTMIADRLKDIQNLELDPDRVMSSVNLIFEVSNTVRDIVFSRGTEPPEEGKPTFMDFIKWVFPGMANMMEAMRSMGYVMLIMVSIGAIHKIVEYLNGISQIKLDENDIRTKINIVLATAATVIGVVRDNEMVKSVKKKDLKDLRKKIESVGGIVEAIGNVVGKVSAAAEVIETMKQVDPAAVQKVTDTSASLQAIINQLESIKFKSSSDELAEKLEKISQINRTFSEFTDISKRDTKGFTDILDTYSEFVKKVDNTSLDKLKTTEGLFRQMAEFSRTIRGNFEGLADSLNDSIAPLLEELRDLISTLPQSIEGSADRIGRTITLTSTEERGLLTSEMARTLEQNINPGLSEDEIARLIEQRMARQNKKQQESIEAKFQELLNILRGQDGTARGVAVVEV